MGKRTTSEVERVCQGFEMLAQEYLKRFNDLEMARDGSQTRLHPNMMSQASRQKSPA